MLRVFDYSSCITVLVLHYETMILLLGSETITLFSEPKYFHRLHDQ